MPQVAPALLESSVSKGSANDVRARHRANPRAASLPGPDIVLSIHEEIATIEPEWRGFERRANGTVFQTCEWLATWQRHIGVRRQTMPAIVVGRDGSGRMLFLMPLAIDRTGLARRLTWLGAELCDYHAPLLAPDFGLWVNHRRFQALWDDIVLRLRSHPRLRFDYIDLQRMPETVGGQANPMLSLGVVPHSSNGYLVTLTDTWDRLNARRSSATRRNDRVKLQKLAALGAINFVTATEQNQIVATLDTLMAQKARWFGEMGIGNTFERPGHRAFLTEIATSPWTRHIAHVSRLEVGGAIAATNLGLIFGDCYHQVLASCDRDTPAARSGPGAAHLHHLLRHAISLGMRKFDFSASDERFKYEWCDTELKLYDHVSAATWHGALIAVPLVAARRVARAVKQSPTLWHAFRKARAAAGSLVLSLSKRRA